MDRSPFRNTGNIPVHAADENLTLEIVETPTEFILKQNGKYIRTYDSCCDVVDFVKGYFDCPG